MKATLWCVETGNVMAHGEMVECLNMVSWALREGTWEARDLAITNGHNYTGNSLLGLLMEHKYLTEAECMELIL